MKEKLFDSFTLKIIAIIVTTIEHAYIYLGSIAGISIPIWVGSLGKLASLIFFFI